MSRSRFFSLVVLTLAATIALLTLDAPVWAGAASRHAGDYVVVFCVWHVPPDQQRGPNGSDDAAASWLFSVDSPRRMEASQP
jgi:hypothetical protein